MKSFFTAVVAILCSLVSASNSMRELSFYAVPKVDKAPVVDGVLDDQAYKNAVECTQFFKYWTSSPEVGGLRGSYKIVYNEQGIFLAIKNFDDNMAKIRKNIIDRDNPDLWTDDCIEIFIDHAASGIGYKKYVINSIGTIGDIWRIDTAVVRDEWNSANSIIKTKIYDDYWTIEAFLPWSDLGEKAQANTLWLFGFVRFGYSSGKFIGVTTSVGGNYSSPNSFGYIYFLDGKKSPNSQQLSNILSENITPPWGLSSGDSLLYNVGQGVKSEKFSTLIANERKIYNQLLQETKSVTAKERASRQKLIATYKEELNHKEDIFLLKSIQNINAQLKKIVWQLKLKNSFN